MSYLSARLLSPILLLALSFTSIFGQDPTVAPTSQGPTIPAWNGCIDPKDPNDLDPRVKIGDPTFICLVIANSVNWDFQDVQYIRLTFQAKADEFSRFIVPASFRQMVSGASGLESFQGRDVAVHAESQTANVFPELTAIIDVEDGVVQAISWDDGCLFCKDSECSKNTFGFNGQEADIGAPVGSCGTARTACDVDSPECDLKLHVVWTGTDVDGDPFLSSAYRFSAFPKQEWGDSLDFPTSFSDLGISFGE
eukprot:scaffold4157_cov136-Cylindrotheca_fusiformis.AAC.6